VAKTLAYVIRAQPNIAESGAKAAANFFGHRLCIVALIARSYQKPQVVRFLLQLLLLGDNLPVQTFLLLDIVSAASYHGVFDIDSLD